MALIVCSDCKNHISSFAAQCPFCGRPGNEGAESNPVVHEQHTAVNVEPVSAPAPDTDPQAAPSPIVFQTDAGVDRAPKEWLIESIMLTGVIGFVGFFLFFCWAIIPFGIVAIYYAMQVNPKWYSGLKDEAKGFSDKAKLWTIITALLFVLAVLGSILSAFLLIGVFRF